jgi:flagellar biogenesis protein FliO
MGKDAQDRLPRMAKTRSIALICCNCVFASLSVRTVEATESTPLPMPSSESTVFSMDAGLWRVFFALLIVAGILLGIRWFIRRTFGGSSHNEVSGKTIQVIERKALGARQSLLLVKVGNKKVLLHQTKGALVPLCELECEEAEVET